MKVIVHKIRLHRGTDPDRFESWVKNSDYATCPELKSLLSFSVHNVSRDPIASFHYFEVITVTDMAAFEEDMKTPQFGALVAAFNQMATVVEEITGEMIPPGFRR